MLTHAADLDLCSSKSNRKLYVHEKNAPDPQRSELPQYGSGCDAAWVNTLSDNFLGL